MWRLSGVFNVLSGCYSLITEPGRCVLQPNVDGSHGSSSWTPAGPPSEIRQSHRASVITPGVFQHILITLKYRRATIESKAAFLSSWATTNALLRLNKSALWKNVIELSIEREAWTAGARRDQTAHLDKWSNPEWRAQRSGVTEGFLCSGKTRGRSRAAANVEFPQLAPWGAERSRLLLSDTPSGASSANPGKSRRAFHLHFPQLCSPADGFIPDTVKDGSRRVWDWHYLHVTRWAGLSRGVSKHCKVMVPSHWNDPISTG